jgi:hypothetical protein
VAVSPRSASAIEDVARRERAGGAHTPWPWPSSTVRGEPGHRPRSIDAVGSDCPSRRDPGRGNAGCGQEHRLLRGST